MTFRKVAITSAVAASLLLTGCDTATVDAIKETANEVVSPTAAPSATPLSTTGPAPTTAAPETIPDAPAASLPSDAELKSMSADGIVSLSKGLVDGIEVKGRAPKTGYDREQFGPAWADVDRNGCDTRNDILERDMTNLTYKDGTKQCVVATGTLADKYTGTTINFVRGQDTSSKVQVDHIIPLSLSWQQGAQQWTAEKRKQFANDPLNLRAADGPTNGSKSDSGPGSWLPPNAAFRCQYIAEFVVVAEKYDLSMNPGDHEAAKRVLNGC